MELSTYFQPVNVNDIAFGEGEFYANIASATQIYAEEGSFPSLEDVTLALLGVCDDSGSVGNKGDECAVTAIRMANFRKQMQST